MKRKIEQPSPLVREGLKTPRAAAIAGILFSVLLTTTLILIKLSVPDISQETLERPTASAGPLKLALNLAPFAGIAFLWFVGVLRDRLGVNEDRFFATVFLGSAILFLAMFFAASAVAGATIMVLDLASGNMAVSGGYILGRAIIARVMNVYALKMAGVFMMSTATIALRTGILPRWITFLGYGFAVLLLLSSRFAGWLGMAFPVWVLIMSIFILIENLRTPANGLSINQMGEGI